MKILRNLLLITLLFCVSSTDVFSQWSFDTTKVNSFAARKFRIEASLGYSIRLGSLTSTGSKELDDYLASFKYGVNYILSIGYKLFGEQNGISLDYQCFNKSNQAARIEMPGVGVTELKNDLSLIYYGISWLTSSSYLDNTFIVVGKLGIGSYNYKNVSEVLNQKFIIESSTYAFYTYISGEYNISNFFTIGLSANYLTGDFNDFTVNGEPNQNLGNEGGTRLDFNLGFRYYF